MSAAAQRLRRAPLSLGRKLGYSAGQAVDGIVNQTVGIFLLFYVTTVCGLPGGLAGLAAALGLIVDAVMDPLIGSSSDGWRSRLGRRLPFMLFGLPLVAVFFVLMFSLPTSLHGLALFAWLTALSIGLRVSMSLFILPYQAVGAELSDDYAERSSIMAWRWGIGMIGVLVAVVLGFGIFFAGPVGLGNRAAYTPFVLTLTGIVVIGGLISARTVRDTLDRQHPPTTSADRLHTRVLLELGEVFRNRSFRVLFIGALLLFASLALNNSLALHANTYFWKLRPAQVQVVTLAVFGGLVLGAPLAGPFLKWMEKRTVLIIGMLGLGVANSVPPLLRLMGLLPFEGTTLVAILASVMFIGGALMAAAAIAFASMMADAADEHEHLFGARREGLYFAGWAFASKAAAGLGALVAGLVLQFIGFPSGIAAQGAAVVIPERTTDLLALFYGPGAGILALGSVVTCWFYRLDAKRHASIMHDLEARRALRDLDASRAALDTTGVVIP